ncbi:hypothetical protein [Streptococcus zalophi]|uniref:hypothetical protein n=1 Tax=Streptococcus zalophi TaxID=640031 RepID=UPI00215C3608|nr:hypothetical protein [Streptococcus zalophi]MCR8967314.1 hypothetical protein [Streptococcus zalophi]
MRKQWLSILVVFTVLIGLVACGTNQDQGNKSSTNNSNNPNIVHYDLEGENLGFTMVIPEESGIKFETTGDNKLLPQFLLTKEEKGEEIFTITGKVMSGFTENWNNAIEEEKDRDDYQIIEKSDTQNLEGYAFSKINKRYFVYLKFDEKRDKTHYLEILIKSNNDTSPFDIYQNEDVNKILGSIKVNPDYKAPEHDYVSDSRDILRMNQFESPDDNYDLRIENPDGSIYVNLFDKNENLETPDVSYNISVSQVTSNKSLEEVIADDYLVKEGKRTYSKGDFVDNVSVFQSEPYEVNVLGHKTQAISFYFEKDDIIYSASIDFGPDKEDLAKKLMTASIDNMTINEEELKNHFE